MRRKTQNINKKKLWAERERERVGNPKYERNNNEQIHNIEA